MQIPHPSIPRPAEIDAAGADSSEAFAYLELSVDETFAVAFALVHYCRRFGTPRTPLQHQMFGLRDFLLDRLDERQVEILLASA